jgi:hypothetical protein
MGDELVVPAGLCRSSNNLKRLIPLSFEKGFHDANRAASLHLFNHFIDTKLGICPKRFLNAGICFTDADKASFSGPFGCAFDAELSEYGIDGRHELVAVLLDMAWGGSYAETFLANGHSGVVDGLDVDIVFLKQEIGSAFCELGVPTSTGMMWDGLGMTGISQAERESLTARVLSC